MEATLKIVIINGSPRTSGLTSAILHGIERSLLEQGEEVVFYNLSELSMSQCKGCCACYKTGHCVMNDDAELLSSVIGSADGLVLGSPTYASNVSGLMKLLIDRGHFVIEQLLTDKYCVTVATGENYGCKDAGKVLNNLVLYSGGKLAYKMCVNAPFNGFDREASGKLGQRAGEKLYRAINTRRNYLFQSVYHKIIFTFGIRPFVLKKGKSYQGVLSKWIQLKVVF